VLAVETQQVCLNYTRVRALLEEGIRLNPGYGEFYERMARLAARDGKHGEVIKYWQKALEISPERPDFNIKIAEGFMSSGEYREAIEILEKYIEISPESGLSYYLLGQAYLQLKGYDESKKYFEKAIEIIPDHPHANYGLATVYIRLKQRDKARQYMEIHNKWRQSRADSRKAYSGSDISGVISDSLDKEFTLFTKHLRKLYLNGSSLYRAGQNLKESEELLKKGEEIFKRAIKIASDEPGLYRELSYIYTVTGRDPARAIEFAEKAVELKESAENYFVLCGAYNRNKDAGKALKALEKAIELDPDNSEYKRTYDMITKGER
jgi:tetratricopeptide (TPR) repeat protein